MKKGEMSDEDIINLVSHFSGVRIKKEYLPLMIESPVIMGPLEIIEFLARKKKLNSEDLIRIKKVFQENFEFFSKSLTPVQPPHEINQHPANNKHSRIKLFLSVLFFSLMLLSGVGCIYSAGIFVPLLITFSVGLILCTCLIRVKSRPVEIIPKILPKIDEIYIRSRPELNSLKTNLNNLRIFFATKYPIKVTNVDIGYITLTDEKSEDEPLRKKSVTFSPALNQLNVYSIDSPESRSRTNSYENNGNLRPKL